MRRASERQAALLGNRLSLYSNGVADDFIPFIPFFLLWHSPIYLFQPLRLVLVLLAFLVLFILFVLCFCVDPVCVSFLSNLFVV